MRSRTRTALLLTVIVGFVGAAVGAAVAFSSDDSPRIPTRAETYSEGMTLDELAKAASGVPGGIAPACPDEETVAKLKSAGKEFGPCDPLPEEGQPFRVPLEGESEETQEGGRGCLGMISGKDGSQLRVEITCAPGAEIVQLGAEFVDGAMCADVTYIAKTGSPARTETLCEGDVPTVGGEVFRSSPARASISASSWTSSRSAAFSRV